MKSKVLGGESVQEGELGLVVMAAIWSMRELILVLRKEWMEFILVFKAVWLWVRDAWP